MRRLLPALLAATVALAACGDDGADVAGGPERGPEGLGERPPGATVERLLEDAPSYYGDAVAVEAPVSQTVVSPGAFTIGQSVVDDDLGIGEGDAVLVLPTAGAEVPEGRIEEGDTVRVEGTVREVTVSLAEEGSFLFEEGTQVDDAFLREFTSLPAIEASRIAPAGGRGESGGSGGA